MRSITNQWELHKITRAAALEKAPLKSDLVKKLFLNLGYSLGYVDDDPQSASTPVAYSKSYHRYRIFCDSSASLEKFIRDELTSQNTSFDLTLTTTIVARRNKTELECRCLIRLPRVLFPKSGSHRLRGPFEDRDQILKTALLVSWAQVAI